MSNITFYNKAFASMSQVCTIIPVREAYVRKSNLPSRWSYARLGMAFSLVPSSSDDANPVAETVTIAGIADHMAFGLVNKKGKLGDSDVKFLGLLSTGGDGDANVYSASGWVVNNSAPPRMRMVIGGVVTTPTTTYSPQWFCGYPANTASNIGYIGVDIGLNYSTGAFSVRANGSGNSYPQSSPSQNALRYYLGGGGASSWTNWCTTTAGGWWGSSAGVDLPYVYVRLPFYNNRLRIHAMFVDMCAPPA